MICTVLSAGCNTIRRLPAISAIVAKDWPIASISVRTFMPLMRVTIFENVMPPIIAAAPPSTVVTVVTVTSACSAAEHRNGSERGEPASHQVPQSLPSAYSGQRAGMEARRWPGGGIACQFVPSAVWGVRRFPMTDLYLLRPSRMACR